MTAAAASPTRRTIRRGAWVAMLALAGAGVLHLPASGADWSFDPVVSLLATRSDNVQVSSAGEAQADSWLRAEVTLAVTGETPRTAFSLSYTPTREIYNDFDSLDNTSHSLRLAWSHRASERSRWKADLRGSLSETPRLYAEDVDLDFVAVPREERLGLNASFGGEFDVGRLSSIFFEASAGAVRYESSVLRGEDLDPDGTGDVPPLLVADADDVGLAFGWERRLSRSQAIRLYWSGSRIDEGFRGETDVNRLLGSWSAGDPSRTRVEVTLGAAQWDLRVPGASFTPALDDEVEAVGGISLVGRAGRRGSFAAGFQHDVSGTGGTAGAVTSDSIYASVVQPTGVYSRFEIFGRLADREPLVDAQGLDPTETVAWGARWWAALSPRWALEISGQRIDQQSGPSPDPRDADYSTISLGLRWAPTAPRS
jgi:hypothetical protein